MLTDGGTILRRCSSSAKLCCTLLLVLELRDPSRVLPGNEFVHFWQVRDTELERGIGATTGLVLALRIRATCIVQLRSNFLPLSDPVVSIQYRIASRNLVADA